LKTQLIKKPLATFLTCLLITGTALASNTATDMYQAPIRVYDEGPVHMVKAAIDTINTDLTLYDPGAEKYACIVGLHASDGTAANLTLKSGTTTITLFELAANQEKRGVTVPICAAKGQDLIMQSSAAYTSLLFMIVEASKMAVK
jgi:hypothetical protein